MEIVNAILRTIKGKPENTGGVGEVMRTPGGTPMERIERALGNRLRADDQERNDLPVALRHEDVLPVSGSVLIAEGRVVSPAQVDRAMDKALGL